MFLVILFMRDKVRILSKGILGLFGASLVGANGLQCYCFCSLVFAASCCLDLARASVQVALPSAALENRSERTDR